MILGFFPSPWADRHHTSPFNFHFIGFYFQSRSLLASPLYYHQSLLHMSSIKSPTYTTSVHRIISLMALLDFVRRWHCMYALRSHILRPRQNALASMPLGVSRKQAKWKVPISVKPLLSHTFLNFLAVDKWILKEDKYGNDENCYQHNHGCCWSWS